MIKVITYGTYDMLHYGHVRLLERAKKLGDYLIVGVTADDFDKKRGKINVQQSLMERIENVKSTGLADEIIVEEYEGQKIDDIQRHNVDIFTVGSDWAGKFDYLKQYCQVIYLERTEGVSSTELRGLRNKVRLGILGETHVIEKYINESRYVNGLEVVSVCTEEPQIISMCQDEEVQFYDKYEEMLESVDAVYIISAPEKRCEDIKRALGSRKHVLCELPFAQSVAETKDVLQMAEDSGVVLMGALKTAYSTAYDRLLLLAKSGCLGKIISVDATCTSLQFMENIEINKNSWNSMETWGATAILPVLQLLGNDYRQFQMTTKFLDDNKKYDAFTKIDFWYDDSVASVKVGKGVKSEGELIVSGTEAYVYVPSPWWKTDYFEIRYENPKNNKRYFYQLDGEGIRYELVVFSKAVSSGKNISLYISDKTICEISRIMEAFLNFENVVEI